MVKLSFNLWTHVLIFLYSNEYRTLSISDVSHDMNIPFSTTSKLCKILVQTRVITLVPIDGRKNKIMLTANGKSLAKSFYDAKDMISKL